MGQLEIFPSSTLFKTEGVVFHIYNGAFTIPHDHRGTWELFLMLEGPIYHILNGTTSVIDKGQMFLLRSSDHHYFAKYKNENSLHASISLTEEYFKGLCVLLTSSVDLYDELVNHKEPLTVKLDGPQMTLFVNKLAKIQTIPKTDYKTQAIMIKLLFSQLFQIIYDHLFLDTNQVPEVIDELISRMRSDAYLDKRVDEICEGLPYSHMQLTRLFKQHMGTTIADYFREIKFTYACNLLANTNFTILNIANRIGFSSLSHFTHFFKKLYSVSPREYRRLHPNLHIHETQ